VKPSDCVDPPRGKGALLEAVRGGEAIAPDVLDHVARCPSCQVSVERTRRIAETLKELEPSPAEVAAAHARFARRSIRSRPVRAGSGVAVLVVLLGGAAFAGARIVGHGNLARSGPNKLHVLGATDGPSAASRSAAPPDRVLPAAAPDVARTEPAPAVPVAPRSANVDPPSPLPPRPTRQAFSRPVTESPNTDAASTGATGWAEAARALRADDHGAAERTFDVLARSYDPRTRDEARLARAQVWVAEGRSREARAELESLAATGATTLVRDRATALLRSDP
jgi:hypothetical protein